MDVSFVSNSEKLIEWFGRWPTFHDAEIVSLELNRSGSSFLSVNTWQISNKLDHTNHYILEKRCTVTFELRDVANLHLEEFGTQNVVFGLQVSKRENLIRIDLEPCYGINGFIEAKEVSVTFQPEA